MTRYILTCSTIDFNEKVDIDRKTFINIKEAREALVAIKEFEETYVLVCQCFYRVEESFANALIKFSLGIEERDYFEAHRRRLGLNLDIMGLLTSFRIYRDHNKKNRLKEINNCFKGKEYHLNFTQPDEIQFLESFRNYVQHHGMPIEGINLSMSHIDEEEGYKTECVGDITINVETCLNSKNFDKCTDFINSFNEKISLRTRFREYFTNLNELHTKIRMEIRGIAQEQRDVIEKLQVKYQQETGYKNNLNSIIAREEINKSVTETVSLFLLWDDVRQRLEMVNSKIGKLSNRYISTRKTND